MVTEPLVLCSNDSIHISLRKLAVSSVIFHGAYLLYLFFNRNLSYCVCILLSPLVICDSCKKCSDYEYEDE